MDRDSTKNKLSELENQTVEAYFPNIDTNMMAVTGKLEIWKNEVYTVRNNFGRAAFTLKDVVKVDEVHGLTTIMLKRV